MWAIGNLLAASIGLPGVQLASWRMALGAALYLGFLATRRRWISADALRHGWQGGVAFGLTASLMFTALQETTVANATVITALQPLVIMALADRLFGERFRPELLAATMVTLGGVALVIFGSTSTPAWSPRGDALAFGALLAWVWYFPASKRAREYLDALTYQTVVLVVGLPIAVSFALVTTGSVGRPTAGQWIGILTMVLIPGTGHLLMNWSHAHIPITLASILTLSVPVLSTIGAAIFIDEPIVAWQVAGMAVVVVGLGWLIRHHEVDQPAAPAEDSM
jgi:drug/metabolite transporter (DMT)-like permease